LVDFQHGAVYAVTPETRNSGALTYCAQWVVNMSLCKSIVIFLQGGALEDVALASRDATFHRGR
jgi:hypothetical protein